jgi:uncharacterized protein
MQFSPVLYLHGFASSPESRKAVFFSNRLRAEGWDVQVPALDGGDFEHLTITRQLQAIERQAKGKAAILIGSSLGGYLASLYAARHPEVRGLVLMAPAFDFCQRWRETLASGQWEEWRGGSPLNVFHYGDGKYRAVDFGLMSDAEKYEAYPDFHQPTIIFHGTADPVVPVQFSAEFAAGHSNVRFVELSSGHELTDVLDVIFPQAQEFINRYGRT